MLSVEEALALILADIETLPAETLPLLAACGRVLARDVIATEAIPPFDNSAMDGYAVRFADVVGATTEHPVCLCVTAELAAGANPSGIRVETGTAVRIMTGAPLPEGADAVVMREDTRERPSEVEVMCEAEPGEHIRRAGEDIGVGDTVLRAGATLKPAALGALAGIGVAEVSVVRRPKVALLATGDELVTLTAPLGPGQIRASSAYALEALVTQLGAEPVQLGIARDDRAELESRLAEGARADLLLTTGGVSVGDHDLVKEVLATAGCVDFWRVNMQPGKPLAFGHVAGTPVIGLPGNPVSTLVAFELFVRPAIRRLQGHAALARPMRQATLTSAISKSSPRRQYLRARVWWTDSGYTVRLAGPQGSHQLTSLVAGNALLILPEGPADYPAGARVTVMLLEEGENHEGGDLNGQ